MTFPGIAHNVPELVDQDESPRGIWRAHRIEVDFGHMEWEPGPENTDGRSIPLKDQVHESGRWVAGVSEYMIWTNADRLDPTYDPAEPDNEENN